MSLVNILSDKRSAVIKKWRDVIVDTYPSDTQRFIRKEKDQFANPVGNIILKDIETLYDELIKDGDNDKITSCLENIIRIRSVQDFRPSQAIGFILHLKRLIREVLGPKTLSNGFSGESQALENRIDDIALLAFDIYSQCRQKIYEIRVSEVQSQVSGLLRRANISIRDPEQTPDFETEVESDN
jgi:hypothetical protein